MKELFGRQIVSKVWKKKKGLYKLPPKVLNDLSFRKKSGPQVQYK